MREVERLPDVPHDDLGHPDAMVSVIGQLAVFDHWRQRVTRLDNVVVAEGAVPREGGGGGVGARFPRPLAEVPAEHTRPAGRRWTGARRVRRERDDAAWSPAARRFGGGVPAADARPSAPRAAGRQQKAPDGGLLPTLAGRGGFEPPRRYKRLPDFESGTFNRSATSPEFAGVARSRR